MACFLLVGPLVSPSLQLPRSFVVVVARSQSPGLEGTHPMVSMVTASHTSGRVSYANQQPTPLSVAAAVQAGPPPRHRDTAHANSKHRGGGEEDPRLGSR